jgi:hypothetical protein
MSVAVEHRPRFRDLVRRCARRAAGLYKGVALFTFNLVVIYGLVNVAAWGFLKLQRRWEAPPVDVVTMSYGPDLLDQVYPEYTREEREILLHETWDREFGFEDFTQLRERPFTGKYVNVSAEGYRLSAEQGPWPPDPKNFNVFLFGGSTLFGLGVADGDTVPSYLQRALGAHSKRRVCAYNFAVKTFYSTQERLRFERLVFEGHVPDVAVFVDGWNDGYHVTNRPNSANAMRELFEHQFAHPWRQEAADVAFRRLPVGKLTQKLSQKPDVLEKRYEESEYTSTDPAVIDRASKTYLSNLFLIEQLCRRKHVQPVFVWQPVPAYKYDMHHHLFTPRVPFASVKALYHCLSKAEDHLLKQPNFLWCADLQEHAQKCLYVDVCHYNKEFSKEFAEEICRLSLQRKLLSEIQ